MVKQIKLTDSVEFSWEYLVNDQLIQKSLDAKEHVFEVNELPCQVTIKINPYKVRPIVRIANIMVNYGLAEITPWDHMLEFKLDVDFFDKYFENIVKAKTEYLNLNKTEAYKKLGYDDLTELVSTIESKIK